jgi:hypothetical protein
MSSWKILAGLSLGVAALLTFRFNRQLREQNHDLEGKYSMSASRAKRFNHDLQGKLRTQTEQQTQLRKQNHDLQGKLRTQTEQQNQLREQNRDLQGKFRTQTEHLETLSDAYQRTQSELLESQLREQEQLGILQVELLR